MDASGDSSLCMVFVSLIVVSRRAAASSQSLGSFLFPANVEIRKQFMIDARQESKFIHFGAKIFAALLFVLCTSIFCQAQTDSSDCCDFSEYKPFTMSHFLKLALIEQAKPIYPPAARMVRAEGEVRVKIIVDRRGQVRDACVVEGHPLLRAAAVQAARETKFKSNFGLSLPQGRYGRRFIQDELVYDFKLD